MKGYINIINRDLKYLPTEDIISFDRNTINSLSMLVNGKWEHVDNYIHFDNDLMLSWIHITPREWKNAKFIKQEDNRLYFEWDDSVLQNYFSHLFRDMEKVVDLVDKSKLWFTNSEIKELSNKLNNLAV